MTRIIKIVLLGLTGSGKTTTLKVITDKVFLASEMNRLPTKDESIAWGIPEDEPISTSIGNNYGSVNVNDKNGSIEMLDSANTKPDYVIMLYDTIGYAHDDKIIRIGDELYRHDALNGAEGVLFIVDSALDLQDTTHPRRILRAFRDVQEYYERNGQVPPLLVFICNKQDIVQKRMLEKGSEGRKIFFETIMRSYDDIFNFIPFINASAKDGWGVRDAFELLIKGIIEIKIKDREGQEEKISLVSDDGSKMTFIKKLEDIYKEKMQRVG